MTDFVKSIIKKALHQAGYDVRRVTRHLVDPKCEGFNNYLAESSKVGADVNDWIEEELGWGSALSELKQVVFPYIDSGSHVLELGPGTGRHARHIVQKLPEGALHLFDHSTWITHFLQQYFEAYGNVYIHHFDGAAIDIRNDSVDFVFSNGMFIELKLGSIWLLSREIFRILRCGGKVAFDYIDISEQEGWRHLETSSKMHHSTFTYHCCDTICRVFDDAGFRLIRKWQKGKSQYVVFEKIRDTSPDE